MGGRAGGGASGGIGSRSRGGGSWPSLTGSEKQIAWANDIRKNAQNALTHIKQNVPGMTPAGKAVLDKWESQMKSMTSASKWIDSRYDVPKIKSGNNPVSEAKYALGMFNDWLGH